MDQQEKQLLKKLNINSDDFEASFGKATVNRGIGYFKAKRARVTGAFDQDSSSIRITGTVKGSGRNEYDTKVDIEADLLGVSISSTCTCPVFHDCKHGVALIFTFIQMLEQQDAELVNEDDVDDWLDFIDHNEQAAHSSHATPTQVLTPVATQTQYHVIYLLNLSIPKYEGDEEGLYIQVVKARLLKKGGYGKEYRLSSYSDVNLAHRGYRDTLHCEPLDEEIVNALKGFENTDSYYSYELKNDFYPKGEIAEIILKKILQTKRGFWQTQKSPPLIEGRHRELLFDWKDQGEHLTLEITTYPDIQSIFKLEHLHYLDIKNATCGSLTHASLTDQQIQYFLAAPPIPKEKAQAVSERLSHVIPEAEVPLPVQINFETIEVKDVKPTFKLNLHAVPVPTIGAESNRLIHLASLSFDYGEIECRATYLSELDKPVSVVIKGETRYRVHRQNHLEKQAIGAALSVRIRIHGS